MLPGTTHDLVIPALERTSGKKYGTGFGVTVNPEFLREGTAIHDFRNPPLTLVGHNYQSDAAPTEALYAKVEAPMMNTSIRTAEMMKYASNTWHALKVCFANEIGNLCKRVEIDSHEVMDIFCRDEKLNLSSYYMKPGFAFGGSCLPKDVRALQYRAKEVDLDMPVIQSILGSNQLQIQHAHRQVVDTGKKRVGLLGFSFKAGTDDLRESPIVILAEALLGKGYELCIYDRNVSIARLVGANKEYINKQIPHLSSLLSESIDEVLDKSDVIVVGNGAPEFARGAEADASGADDRRSRSGEDGSRRRSRQSIQGSAGDSRQLPVTSFQQLPDLQAELETGSCRSSPFQKSLHLPPDVVEASQQLMVVVEHVQLDVRSRLRPALHRRRDRRRCRAVPGRPGLASSASASKRVVAARVGVELVVDGHACGRSRSGRRPACRWPSRPRARRRRARASGCRRNRAPARAGPGGRPEAACCSAAWTATNAPRLDPMSATGPSRGVDRLRRPARPSGVTVSVEKSGSFRSGVSSVDAAFGAASRRRTRPSRTGPTTRSRGGR